MTLKISKQESHQNSQGSVFPYMKNFCGCLRFDMRLTDFPDCRIVSSAPPPPNGKASDIAVDERPKLFLSRFAARDIAICSKNKGTCTEIYVKSKPSIYETYIIHGASETWFLFAYSSPQILPTFLISYDLSLRMRRTKSLPATGSQH